MTEPTLRRLQPTDAAAYRELMLWAYAAHPDAFSSSAAERAALPLAWWQARLAEGAHASEQVWAMGTGQALLGVAGLARETRTRLRHKATLFGMVVQPAQRGRGLGEQLLRAVLQQAWADPALAVVNLTVSQGNTAAQRLYQRCGFVAFGLEPMAVQLDGGRHVAKCHMQCRRPG